ncbi:MAG: hypothetical protein AAFX40_17770, partial [Cyanobacteria bacterium J06639_1]
MKPGSLPWLLKYELVLKWRSLAKLTRMLVLVLVGGGILYIAVTSVVGIQLLLQVRDSIAQGNDIPAVARSLMSAIFLWSALAVQILMWTLSLFQAMNLSLEALFQRGDLDLLVSSPIRGEVIFSSRLIIIALTVFASWAPFLVPAIAIGVGVGFPQILGALPTLVCMAILSASTGAILILGLVKLLGVQRARIAGQITASLIGASFFLLTQSLYWFDDSWLESNVDPEALEPIAEDSARRIFLLFSDGGAFSADHPLLFPARSLVFHLPSLILFVGLSAIAFWLTVKIAFRSFLKSTQQSTTRATRKRRNQTTESRFQTGVVRTMLLKEWRSIWRNPFVISRLLLSVLYLIPATILILRSSEDSSFLNVGGALSSQVGLISVFFGSTLVASLTAICVSAEEAVDLLASAPVSGDRLRTLKLAAAIAPVWLLFTPLYGWLIYQGVERWEWVAIAFVGSTLSTAAIGLWAAAPLPRSDLFRKHTNENG